MLLVVMQALTVGSGQNLKGEWVPLLPRSGGVFGGCKAAEFERPCSIALTCGQAFPSAVVNIFAHASYLNSSLLLG